MLEAIEKADVLIEALPYIRDFHHKPIVVKLGGSSMGDPAYLACAVEDIVFLRIVGIAVVIVHGGGPAISRAMRDAGRTPRFVGGLRVTDDETLEIATRVLIDGVNGDIVEQIRAWGCRAVATHPRGLDVVRARRREPVLVDGEEIDLGRVGEVVEVDADAILDETRRRVIPVMAPVACDESGVTLNVNADSVAAHVAASLGAAKLVVVSDTHGIYTDVEEKESLVSTLTESEIDGLIERKVIEGGMLPKVEACLKALKHGVGKAHIIDGRVRHSLLLEIFTDEGIGTQIVHDEERRS